MRKTLVGLLLALASASAMAEWILVWSNPAQDLDWYYDPATLRRAGGNVKMKTLTNYVVPAISQQGTFGSEKDDIEVDCKARTYRVLSSFSYKEHMAAGKVTLSEPGIGKWEEADFPFNLLVNVACEKK